MDVEEETWKFKLMLAVVIAFIVSTFFAYFELKYAVAGKTTSATVERVSDIRMRRGSVRTVYYNYRDANGNIHHGSDDLGRLDAVPESGDTIVIDYLDDTSRLHGHRRGGALMVFFGSLIAMVVGGALFWRHIQQAIRPSPSQQSYKVPKRF